MVLPVFFVPVITRFPVGLLMYWMTTNLWTVGQGIDHAADGPEAGGAAEADLAHAAEGRPRRRCRQRRGAEQPPSPQPAPAVSLGRRAA